MKKLFVLALTAAALLPAETISFSFSGHQESIDAYFEGSGSFVVPNGTVTADLSSVEGFNLVLYDILSSTNPAYAYGIYSMNQVDLLQFSASFDSNGNPEQITFQTSAMDQNNSESSVGANWTPDGIQPMGNVGGFRGIEFTVTSAVIPEPSYAFAAGLLLFGFGAWRRRLSSRLS